MDWRERCLRTFGPGLVGGTTLGDWLRLLWRNGFRISMPCWPKAVSATGWSTLNTPLRWLELAIYSRRIAAQIVLPPLFVLGHWRSGTTHLHNLFAVDRRFSYPRLSQVMNPHTFLLAEPLLAAIYRATLPGKRFGVDNMGLQPEVPSEEEFAVLVLTFMSPCLGWVFPERTTHYDRYLTFRDVPTEELERWKAGYMTFLKKLALRDPRPLVLKSPPNTARIKLLLEMFPEARFVHIRRNPYVVYQSTERLALADWGYCNLQRPDRSRLHDEILQRYNRMYDVFFEEKSLIPAGQFAEVGFEELERNPVGELKRIYEELQLGEFDSVEAGLQSYVQSLAGYQKNNHPDLRADVRSSIAKAWRRSFEEWKYLLEEQ